MPTFGPLSSPAAGGRVESLDGLRGWAALCVVCFHAFWETFGARFPAYRTDWTGFILDGPLAVSIFFVLSGEALSFRYFTGGGRPAAVRLAVARYPRLAIPVAAAAAIVAVLTWAGLTFNHAAGAVVGRPDWLGRWLQAPITVGRLLAYVTFRAFAKNDPSVDVDPFLWTMRVEAEGSCLVLASLLLLHGRRIGWPLVAFASIALLVIGREGGQLACFLAGMGLARLRASGTLQRVAAGRWTGWLSGLLLVLLAAADAFVHAHSLPGARRPAIAIALVALVSISPLAQRALSSRPSRLLGAVSFPLYLVQFAVIVSLTSWLIVRAGAGLTFATSAEIAAATIAASLAAAVAFWPVEWLAKHASRGLARAVLARLGEPGKAKLGGVGEPLPRTPPA